MEVRPILFNTELVKAILGDRKTQTRRLVKEIPLYAPYFDVPDGIPMACDEYGDWYPAERFSRIQPGDVLWVRETWAHPSAAEIGMGADPNMYIYKADEPALPCACDKWRPSIHMPREAARLFLRVTNIRIERLKEISDEDALAEGVSGEKTIDAQGNSMWFIYPYEDFATLWDGTVKKADLCRYGWNANPWVWVIEFERCSL